jgi:hypothetical protein
MNRHSQENVYKIIFIHFYKVVLAALTEKKSLSRKGVQFGYFYLS